MTRAFWIVLFLGISTSSISGCTSAPKAPTLNDAAKEKVKAISAIADELEKDQEGIAAVAALENFRTQYIDTEKHADQVSEMVGIYQKRIQGKYQGSVARELQVDMAPYLAKKK